MSVILYDVCYLHGDDVHLRIALAVAGLDSSIAQLLHVHALASGSVCLRNETQFPVKGHYLDGKDAFVTEPVGADIEICKHGACIH